MTGARRRPTDEVTLTIERCDGAQLVIRNADWLAEAFFRLDPSGRAGGFDSWVIDPQQQRDRLTEADIGAINRTMRARSALKWWRALLDGDQPWLAELDPAWELFSISDELWSRTVREPLRRAISQLINKGRRLSVATKALHIKRPALVPVCDSLVIKQLGCPTFDTAEGGVQLIDHIRQCGRVQADALRDIHKRLEHLGIKRTPVRILDALLWSSHPDSAMFPVQELIARWREGNS